MRAPARSLGSTKTKRKNDPKVAKAFLQKGDRRPQDASPLSSYAGGSFSLGARKGELCPPSRVIIATDCMEAS